MDNKEIISRWDHLLNERRGTVDGTWDLVDRFVMPMRGDFYSSLNSEGEVDWHRRDVYDATAVFAAQSLSAAMQSNLTSSSQKWFDLKFRDDDLNREDAPTEWLEECGSRIYQALNEANFDIEIGEAYTDLVGFGTSVLIEEVDDNGQLLFSAVPLRDTCFEQDHQKQVYRFYRLLQWTPIQIVSKFGEENVPERIKERADSPEGSTQREDIIFCIFPRDGKVDNGQPLAPKVRPFGYKYVLHSGQETLGDEGGYYEMPAFVSRWRTVAGSRWGKSPSIDGMGDILTLNQIKEATLEAAGKAIDPANMAEETAILGNEFLLDRGSMNIVRDINGIRPYESGTKFDVSNLEIGMLTDAIKNYFYQNQLELKESPAMTATEVNVRYELMQRMLGPTLGRLKNDLLDPLIQRTFNILYRTGQLPEMPENMEIGQMDIEYTGPLPRAQKGQTATEIIRFLGDIAQLAQVYPQAMDLPDVDEAFRLIASLRGVPAKALNSQRDIDVKRKREAQQQQAAMAMQAAQGAGQAMQAMGEGGQAMQEAGMEGMEGMQ